MSLTSPVNMRVKVELCEDCRTKVQDEPEHPLCKNCERELSQVIDRELDEYGAGRNNRDLARSISKAIFIPALSSYLTAKIIAALLQTVYGR